MRTEYLKVFRTALVNTFKTTVGCELHGGDVHGTSSKLHDVTGVVGLSGRAIGSVIFKLFRASGTKGCRLIAARRSR